MKLSKNISRLSLHDSHIISEVRVDDSMAIVFDWAKLKNLLELGINQAVILGKTTLKISGIKNEVFTALYDNGERSLIEFPDNVNKYWSEVSNTEIDDKSKRLMLDGLFTKDGESFWVEWSLNYDNCEVEWNSHITVAEWLNGKLPTD
jgi:hypothetical protein